MERDVKRKKRNLPDYHGVITTKGIFIILVLCKVDLKCCRNKTQTAPVGSTSLASLIASDVAISWFAGEIANIIEFG